MAWSSKLAGCLLCPVVALFALGVDAQEAYPSRPVRLISCCQGLIDITARTLADQLAPLLKQPVVVETRPGAGGMIAADAVAKSSPDGYTILIGTSSQAANPSLFAKVPFDFVGDFAPIGGIAQGVLILVVDPKLPVATLPELTALARRQPGALTFGWGASSARASGELYKQLAGVSITGVPYKSGPQAMLDVIAGRIDMMWADLQTALPQVNAGKIKVLAVGSRRRNAKLAHVPTMAEGGVPDFELTFWVAAWAPANTPRDVVARLGAALGQVLQTPRTAEFFANSGLDAFAIPADQLMKFQIAEHDKWKRILATAGIQPE